MHINTFGMHTMLQLLCGGVSQVNATATLMRSVHLPTSRLFGRPLRPERMAPIGVSDTKHCSSVDHAHCITVIMLPDTQKTKQAR